MVQNTLRCLDNNGLTNSLVSHSSIVWNFILLGAEILHICFCTVNLNHVRLKNSSLIFCNSTSHSVIVEKQSMFRLWRNSFISKLRNIAYQQLIPLKSRYLSFKVSTPIVWNILNESTYKSYIYDRFGNSHKGHEICESISWYDLIMKSSTRVNQLLGRERTDEFSH